MYHHSILYPKSTYRIEWNNNNKQTTKYSVTNTREKKPQQIQFRQHFYLPNNTQTQRYNARGTNAATNARAREKNREIQNVRFKFYIHKKNLAMMI